MQRPVFEPACTRPGNPLLLAARLWLILAEQGRAIPCAVDHADDDKRRVRGAVVDHVVPVEMRPQAGREVLAAWPQLGLVPQGLKSFLDLPDEGARPFRRGFGDERPDFGKIVFGLFGYAEDERASNFFLPFSMILSASKSCTRPASISSIPACTSARSRS